MEVVVVLPWVPVTTMESCPGRKSSCSTWGSVRSSKPNEAAVYEAWILGFLSAYNAFVFKGPNVADGFDFDALRVLVDEYCRQNPKDDLDSAAQSLIKELLKKNPG